MDISSSLVGSSYTFLFAGTASFEWAFSEDENCITQLVCDVLPNCNYSLILGSQFLAATKTLTRYKYRLTECMFSTVKSLRVNLLGDYGQRLQGKLRRGKKAFVASAAADTGAEANVMDHRYEKYRLFSLMKLFLDLHSVSLSRIVGLIPQKILAFDSSILNMGDHPISIGCITPQQYHGVALCHVMNMF